MIPTLRVLSDGVVRTRRELCPRVADIVGLSDDDRKITLSSGQKLYENRIGWGLSFLANVGAFERPARGHYTITDAGRQVLAQFPDGVAEQDIKALGADPSSAIREYASTAPRKRPESADAPVQESSKTPVEQVEAGIDRINADVSSELLSRLRDKEPEFFERAVIDLLLAMGYGGANGRGLVTQLSHDGGIDGVVDQDILGLSRVYVQAKRYAATNSVQAPEVRGFLGAVHGQANSGVFITTSRFSQGAHDVVRTSPTRIVLIDGDELTKLMIRFKVGTQVRKTHEIVEIDEDFFA
ncbi:restriction endonuclease [Microbacterium panaciterrae]